MIYECFIMKYLSLSNVQTLILTFYFKSLLEQEHINAYHCVNYLIGKERFNAISHVSRKKQVTRFEGVAVVAVDRLFVYDDIHHSIILLLIERLSLATQLRFVLFISIKKINKRRITGYFKKLALIFMSTITRITCSCLCVMDTMFPE